MFLSFIALSQLLSSGLLSTLFTYLGVIYSWTAFVKTCGYTGTCKWVTASWYISSFA
jgi:hypothetical protein